MCAIPLIYKLSYHIILYIILMISLLYKSLGLQGDPNSPF